MDRSIREATRAVQPGLTGPLLLLGQPAVSHLPAEVTAPDELRENDLDGGGRLRRLAKGCSAASAAEPLVRSPMRQRQLQSAGTTRVATAACRWLTPDLTTGIRARRKLGSGCCPGRGRSHEQKNL